MDNHLKTFSDSVEAELLSTGIDLSQEYAQFAIGELLDNEVFKEIPIVKTIWALTKGTLAIREWVFARKLAVFFQKFHEGVDSHIEKQKILYEIQANPIKRNKIVEQVIVMNERYIDTNKSIIHANLLIAHLIDKLTWDEFSDLLICVDTLHPKSIARLTEIALSDTPFQTKSIGRDFFDNPLNAVGLASQRFSCYIINNLGRKLYYYGLRRDFDSSIPLYVHPTELQ